jgi:dipeptidyl aminopeptidase/acylaminoacyl peptidase
MEWGLLPHQGNMMDVLWERSALKHVAKVKTPVMLIHGENDSDVPIAESEQFYIALKDVAVETVMVRYPREGHGLREPRHIVDSIDRSIQWYAKHFPAGAPGSTTAIRRPSE